MATGNRSREEVVTAKDAELAERTAAEARARAAHAPRTRGCQPLAAWRHRPSNTQNSPGCKTGPSNRACPMWTYTANRDAAVEDRKLAELKRKESEADLAVD
ncbi:hypothetical protein MSEO_24250 [Mycobacterium seoulense]|uniref:Uncharacterized protein n=1 Tax=Mycobacterium seoulense TaxID=386911 RepID=A0A7I7NZ43_9MYCO|nr:hypothetical protein MSEO_24250 [Mycobacterium seoulense]